MQGDILRKGREIHEHEKINARNQGNYSSSWLDYEAMVYGGHVLKNDSTRYFTSLASLMS